MKDMAATAVENQKNREAESAYVRKNLWGAGEAKADEDDMGHTILGDVTYPAPVVISQPAQQSSSALPLVIGMLASGLMGGGAAGLATYMLTRDKSPVQQQQFNDETVQIGLGRIEDYTKSDEASEK